MNNSSSSSLYPLVDLTSDSMMALDLFGDIYSRSLMDGVVLTPQKINRRNLQSPSQTRGLPSNLVLATTGAAIHLGQRESNRSEVEDGPPSSRQAYDIGVLLNVETPRSYCSNIELEVEAPRAHIQHDENHSTFRCLRKFDGVITSRDGETFWARLCENNSDHEEVDAEFALDELSDSDHAIAVEGAPIVWSIGYSVVRGTRKRESIMYVRRVQPPSAGEVAKAKQELLDAMTQIPWE